MGDDYSLRARVVQSDVVMEATFGVAESPSPMDGDEISNFIDRGGRYTNAVIHLAQQLNLIEETSSGCIINPSIGTEIKKASPDQRFAILNKMVHEYEPFVTFCSFINKGYSADESAQKVNVLYEFGLDINKLKEQLLNIGEYSETLSNDSEVEVVGIEDDPLSSDYVEELLSALKSDMTARLFLEDRLGEDIVSYLDQGTFQDLIAALRLFQDEPRSAIGAAGRAVEDFQRELADDYGSSGRDYTSASGIGQLTNNLQGDGLMMKRHLHGGNYLSGMRNPSGGHGKSKKTLKRWDVSSDVALGYILAAIHYIKSQHSYVANDNQVL